MKKYTLLTGLFSFLIAIMFQACYVEDPAAIPELEPYLEENFSSLEIEAIQSIETPFQSVFQSSNARTKEGIDLEEISSRLAEIFPDAEVLEVEEETERGLSVWEIKLKMPGGGILKLVFVQELGLIIKIKGKSGPYDYEVDPGGSFIPFSEAARLALEAVGGEIQKWELELEEEDQWEYEIHVNRDGKRYEIEIKGFETEVISIKQKEENEDIDGQEEQEATPPDAVAELVLSLFTGEIIHSETKEDGAHQLWKIYVESESGAVVKFKILEEPLELLEMEGEKGPFDYDIDPGDPFLTLNEGLEIAMNVFPGELHKWEFEIIRRGDNSLTVYEFKLTDGDLRFEILIHAETGEVLDIEDSEHNGDNNDVPVEIAEFVLALFPGEIIEGHFIHNDAKNFWKLHVRSESGAVVRFLIGDDPISLLEMKAEEGPFNYNIDPGEALISLEEAREIAASVNDGELMAWKFGFEGDDENFFPFYLIILNNSDGQIQILIHAETGEVVDFDGHEEKTENIPDAVAELALTLFPGEIIEGELIHRDGQNMWKLYVTSESGAIVRFIILDEPVELLEMRGEHLPFDYDIDPGASFISLQESIEIAMTEVDGDLLEWKFGFESDGGGFFPFYLLHFVGENYKVTVLIHAESGEIIHIERHGEPGSLPEEVAAFALSFFQGEIIEFHPDHENNHRTWKVYIISETGSIIAMVIKQDPLILLKMIGENGPFEYNIEPGEGFISLSAAREMAEMEVLGELGFWAFNMIHGHHTDQVLWVYELLYSSADSEFLVIVNAESGEIIEIKGRDDDDNGDHHDLAPEEVTSFAQSFFDGEVIHSEKHIEGDAIIWELLLESESGAQVKFYILEDQLGLLEMKSIEGPFDYNIEPGDPFISLASAVEIAQGEFDGELTQWRFRNEDHDDGEIKVYEILLATEENKVEFLINAESGEIININD